MIKRKSARSAHYDCVPKKRGVTWTEKHPQRKHKASCRLELGRPRSRRESCSRTLPSVLRALPTLHFRRPASRTVGQQTSVALSHPVCGSPRSLTQAPSALSTTLSPGPRGGGRGRALHRPRPLPVTSSPDYLVTLAPALSFLGPLDEDKERQVLASLELVTEPPLTIAGAQKAQEHPHTFTPPLGPSPSLEQLGTDTICL